MFQRPKLPSDRSNERNLRSLQTNFLLGHTSVICSLTETPQVGHDEVAALGHHRPQPRVEKDPRDGVPLPLQLFLGDAQEALLRGQPVALNLDKPVG